MTPPINQGAPAAVCGTNPVFPPERVGCGQRIETCAEVFRCTDCGTPFHRECARRHFGQHGREESPT